jgi:signal peptidase I
MSDKFKENDTNALDAQSNGDTQVFEYTSPDGIPVPDAQDESGKISESSQDGDSDKNERSFAQEIFDWAESIIIALVAAVLLLTFVARASMVDGDSMLPTLHNGELLIVSRMFYSVDHEDIIVLLAKDLQSDDGSGETGKAIVKRVIGLPGDEITINITQGIVIRNGEKLDITLENGVLYENGHTIAGLTNQPRDLVTRMETDSTGEQTVSVTVPEGCVFLLGDNRPRSKDSRYNEIGMVDERYIIGEVLLRVTPLEKFGTVA